MNNASIWVVIFILYILIIFRKKFLNIIKKLTPPENETERWYNEHLKGQFEAKTECYYQKFSTLKDRFSNKYKIKFRNTTEAFLFACENSACLERYQPLVGIVREIYTDRYIYDITKFAPVYNIEIALNTGTFNTIVYSPVIDYYLNVGSLVVWVPTDFQDIERSISGLLQSEIYPVLSLKTGWKIKKHLNNSL